MTLATSSPLNSQPDSALDLPHPDSLPRPTLAPVASPGVATPQSIDPASHRLYGGRERPLLTTERLRKLNAGKPQFSAFSCVGLPPLANVTVLT